MDVPTIVRQQLLEEIQQAICSEGKAFTLDEQTRMRVFLEIIDGTESPHESEAAAETWLATS